MISHSEAVRYEKYRDMPVDRIELFRNLVQLRMVYYEGGFLSHLDVLNKIVYGKCFDEGSDKERRQMFSVWNLPSLNGILAINQLVENDFNCKIINNFDAEIDLIKKYTADNDRPIIGISTTFILQWSEVGRIAQFVREIAPHATLILGGAFINDQFLNHGAKVFERPLRKYGIDYVVHSFNSETDLLELLKTLRSSGDLSTVNNLAYLDSNSSLHTTRPVWNEPIVNFPAKSWSRLYSAENMGATLQLRTTSGCPFSCAFCTYPVKAGGFATSDLETFREQLEAIKKLGTVDSIIIIDDTPNVPLARFKKLVQILKDYNFRWYSFLRVQYMDDELAADMAASGCDGVYLGLESANEMVLKAMHKQASVAEYRRGISQLKKAGITVFAAFVLGFPGETAQSVEDNMAFIKDAGIDFYSLKEFYYSHSAPVHKKREEFNLTGHGNRWSHSTMTSDETSSHKLRMFDDVTASCHVDSDSGLWYLAYLRERGFQWEEIKEIQNCLSDMMRLDNANEFNKKSELIARLRRILEIANFKDKPSTFATTT